MWNMYPPYYPYPVDGKQRDRDPILDSFRMMRMMERMEEAKEKKKKEKEDKDKKKKPEPIKLDFGTVLCLMMLFGPIVGWGTVHMYVFFYNHTTDLLHTIH